MEERWKTIDLTIFQPVPQDKLEADKLYIMYGNADIYPKSRWKIRFKQRISNKMIAADIVDVIIDRKGYDKNNYIGNDQKIGTDSFIFYDYNENHRMKSEIRDEITNRRKVPSLASMAQNTMRYTDEFEAAKDYGVFGLRRGIGGFSKKKKTRRRKTQKKYKKNTTSSR
jgi:hypothetical protein